MISRTLICLSIMLVAAPASPQQPDTPVVVQGQPGTIVIYRLGSVLGAAVACPVRWKGEDVTELGRSRFTEWQVEPGRYILENRNASLEVSVVAGETRYVRCQIKSGFLAGRADLQIVDGSEFLDKRGSLQLTEIQPE